MLVSISIVLLRDSSFKVFIWFVFGWCTFCCLVLRFLLLFITYLIWWIWVMGLIFVGRAGNLRWVHVNGERALSLDSSPTPPYFSDTGLTASNYCWTLLESIPGYPLLFIFILDNIIFIWYKFLKWIYRISSKSLIKAMMVFLVFKYLMCYSLRIYHSEKIEIRCIIERGVSARKIKTGTMKINYSRLIILLKSGITLKMIIFTRLRGFRKIVC